MEVFLIILACIAILIIDYLIAKEFYAIATDKGYVATKYLWIPFLLGIVGYLLVVALPDRNKNAEPPKPQTPQKIQKLQKAPLEYRIAKNSDEVICCDKCGTDNPKGAKVCKKCKSQLNWQKG